MGTQTQISMAEYLHSAYRPDREYVDGEVRERNVGKWEHARIQWLLASWFASHESEWNVMGSTEQRLQVTATSVRIPDLVIVESGPQPEVLINPPLLVIEILSPDDTYSGLEDRVHDYQTMGIQDIWLVDPVARAGRTRVHDSWSAATTRLMIDNSPIYVDLNDIFRFLEQKQSCCNARLDRFPPSRTVRAKNGASRAHYTIPASALDVEAQEVVPIQAGAGSG